MSTASSAPAVFSVNSLMIPAPRPTFTSAASSSAKNGPRDPRNAGEAAFGTRLTSSLMVSCALADGVSSTEREVIELYKVLYRREEPLRAYKPKFNLPGGTRVNCQKAATIAEAGQGAT